MDVQQHNLNALLLGTSEFHFCEFATTALQAATMGYTDFGNVTSFQPKPDKQTEDHKGSYRGITRIDQTAVKQATSDYILKCDEWDFMKMQSVWYGSPGAPFTQTVKAAVAGTVLPFTTSAAKIGLWYDLMIAGVRIKEITTCTMMAGAALVENVDFVLDRKLGRVRFLTAQAADVTPTITAPAITNPGDVGYRNSMTPLTKVIRTGIGRLFVFDQDNADIVNFEHTDFGCEIWLDSVDAIDGDKYTNIGINVRLTLPLGTVYSRN